MTCASVFYVNFRNWDLCFLVSLTENTGEDTSHQLHLIATSAASYHKCNQFIHHTVNLTLAVETFVSYLHKQQCCHHYVQQEPQLPAGPKQISTLCSVCTHAESTKGQFVPSNSQIRYTITKLLLKFRKEGSVMYYFYMQSLC